MNIILGIVTIGAGLLIVYKLLNKKNPETTTFKIEDEVTFSEFKEYLTNKLISEDIIKQGQNPKDVFIVGIEEFIQKALTILDNESLTAEEKKEKLLDLYNNPTKYLEKKKKLENIDLDKKFNKVIKFEGVPAYIEIDLKEFKIPKEKAVEDLVTVTKEILTKGYEKGVNYIKNSLSIYIENLEQYKDHKKLTEELNDIKRKLLWELENL